MRRLVQNPSTSRKKIGIFFLASKGNCSWWLGYVFLYCFHYMGYCFHDMRYNVVGGTGFHALGLATEFRAPSILTKNFWDVQSMGVVSLGQYLLRPRMAA